MFNIDFTFFWTAVNLLIIYVVLKKLLFKRLGGFMDNRAQSIAADIEKGRQLITEGEQLREQNQKWLEEAAEQRRGILEDAARKAALEYDALINEAKREAQYILKEAREEALREREQMLKELRRDMADLAIEAASKVIEANMDNERNRALVNRFLSDMEVA